MPNTYFPNGQYTTPSHRKRALGDILSLGTSVYFNLRFLTIVLANRGYARRNAYDTPRWALSSFEILQFLERCGGRFHITGLEHVETVRDEPVVFISNHMSILETMVFPCLIAPTKEVTFVVKSSLLTNALFGPIMRARHPIAVDRQDPRADLVRVIDEGLKKLAQGISVIIFPQSTRTLDFHPESFNSLGVKLAQRAGVRVIPIAIKTDFWANGRLIKDMGSLRRKEPIHIAFGAPMPIRSGKDDHQRIVDFIQEHLAQWQGGAGLLPTAREGHPLNYLKP